jgi:hypothetical protein
MFFCYNAKAQEVCIEPGVYELFISEEAQISKLG